LTIVGFKTNQNYNESKVTRGPHLKQVDDEASNNARICKMTTMPPYKTTKNIHEEDQYGGSCSKL
jgi:hypothetical protein